LFASLTPLRLASQVLNIAALLGSACTIVMGLVTAEASYGARWQGLAVAAVAAVVFFACAMALASGLARRFASELVRAR
jgi:hypothetical protein